MGEGIGGIGEEMKQNEKNGERKIKEREMAG